MGRSAIDDQNDHAAGDQTFQNFDENCGVDAALLFHHEAHVAA
jgi:hypothetical protein